MTPKLPSTSQVTSANFFGIFRRRWEYETSCSSEAKTHEFFPETKGRCSAFECACDSNYHMIITQLSSPDLFLYNLLWLWHDLFCVHYELAAWTLMMAIYRNERFLFDDPFDRCAINRTTRYRLKRKRRQGQDQIAEPEESVIISAAFKW